MPLRDQRMHRPAVTEVVHDTDVAEVTYTSLHAHQVCTGEVPFAIGWHVPGCHWHYLPDTRGDGCWSVWFLDPASRSWARFDYQPDTERWPVHQFGPRRLWDEIDAAYRGWEQAARPPVEQWTVTITPNGQHLKLGATPTVNHNGVT